MPSDAIASLEELTVEVLLSSDELAFLQHHNLTTSDVLDARYLSKRDRETKAKNLGKILLLGVPCQVAGHRLRTRAGHCVQCDPKKLAFEGRSSKPGFVYIAGSLRGRVLKIGFSENVFVRHAQLQSGSYGGYSDWKLLFIGEFANAGSIEMKALSLLRRYKIVRPYIKDGLSQDAAEMVRCGFKIAFLALYEAIGTSKPRTLWKIDDHKEYEFVD